ncbi:uncharacterized protein LOC143268271 [Peromyscus maniculatus bairdii]|uniref:uncharacterized protein LOC143268271 n=1 Tax=Peromyscus maniculatus bairdii TaxID=230844 RepID=UPI003FD4D771
MRIRVCLAGSLREGGADVLTCLERRGGRASGSAGARWPAGDLGAPWRISSALLEQARAFLAMAPFERSMSGKQAERRMLGGGRLRQRDAASRCHDKRDVRYR